MVLIEKEVIKSQELFEALQGHVRMMAEQITQAHTAEQGIWDGLLKLGNALLDEYFAQHGTGDVGEYLTLPSGQQLPKRGLHTRRYMSVFGPLDISRMCYGRGEIEIVPLDAMLNLPKNKYSYLLQQWSQSFVVHDAYNETVAKFEKLFHLRLSIRTLENLNREIAQSVKSFHETQPAPDASSEGTLIVAASDGTRVPICRAKPKRRSLLHLQKKKMTINKQKIACVGAVYTIEPFYRTAEDVIDELIRKQAQKRRPIPQHKHVQAHLIKGKEGTFSWMAQEVITRNPGGKKTVICLCDGEKALWAAKRRYLKDAIEIVDIFHVMEKLWSAAHCFHKEGSLQIQQFVEHRLRMLLEGKVSYVISGLRQMATKRQIENISKKNIDQVTAYFQYNRSRMRYDEYMAKGYPIGSGVAEGACRHLVKDRLHRTGMRWTMEGAQAMLDLRAVYLNDEWESFWEYHMQRQHDLLYGHIAPLAIDKTSKTA